MPRSKPQAGPGERVRQKTPPRWSYRGMWDGQLCFEKRLSAETVLWAYATRRDDGRAHVHELRIPHPTSAGLRIVGLVELEEEIQRAMDEQESVGWGMFLTACGIDSRAPVARGRGPRPRRDDESLDSLVDQVLLRQAAGEKATDQPGYSKRRIRELMRDAEERGLVAIDQVDGRPNVYRRPES